MIETESIFSYAYMKEEFSEEEANLEHEICEEIFTVEYEQSLPMDTKENFGIYQIFITLICVVALAK